ncbi:MAG: hypothetical protein QW117_01075 [Candidatus Pacearchaeota archaeon]
MKKIKKADLEMDFLGKIILILIFLFLVLVAYGILSGKLKGMVINLKNLFRFG